MEKTEAFTNEFEEMADAEKKKQKMSKLAKVIIIILSIVILFLSIIIILMAIKKKDKKENSSTNNDGNENNKEGEYDSEAITNFLRKIFLGEVFYNLTYATEKVENTFKINGKNYREEIGPVNDNEDYISNNYNIYDLYIPYSANKTKKSKGIILFIHGGAWIQGSKEEMTYLCQIYFEHEYIIANLDYTLLSEKVNNTNIYRQLDDISACINDIKSRLVKMGFKETELEIAIGGGSAGAHLSLLYGYLVKEPPLPVRFIMDAIGPVNLETDDFYVIEKDEDTLPDIEPNTVNEALKKKTYNKPLFNETYIIRLMNLFIGNKYSLKEQQEIFKDNKIDKENPKYKELYEKSKYGSPLYWMKDKDIPILAHYGGKDLLIGFVQYARLRETADKYNNTLQLVYSRYGGHGLSEYEHPEGIIAAKDFHFYMLKFCDDYFTKFK